jgi:hypothetical protein
VTDAPVDDLLAEAFGKGRDQIMSTLFNKDRYRQLVDSGLVLTQAGADALKSELDGVRTRLGTGEDRALRDRVAELERRLRAPVFEFGGLTDVPSALTAPGVDSLTPRSKSDDHAGLVPPVPVPRRRTQRHRPRGRRRRAPDRRHVHRACGGAAQVQATFNLPGEHEPIAGHLDRRGATSR